MDQGNTLRAPMAENLLILACSATKAKVPEGRKVPAWGLYDGLFYRAIKKSGFRLGTESRLDLLILSAKYGILSPFRCIETYNEKMTRARAIEIRPVVVESLRVSIWGRYKRVILCMGQVYKLALIPYSEWCPSIYRIEEIKGKGIGYMVSNLKKTVEKIIGKAV